MPITIKGNAINVKNGNKYDNISVFFAKDLPKNYVTPEMYGAIGDGIADDTSALQTMFNTAPDKYSICLMGRYKVTNGIIIGKARNIFSFGLGTRLPSIFGSTDDYIVKFDSSIGDVREIFIENISFSQSGVGDCVLFDNCSAINNWKIVNCVFSTPYSTATGYSLNAINALSHSFILGCRFWGNGFRAKIYDANTIDSCFFAGTGDGIVFDCAYGVLNNTIRNSTIVNNGGNAVRIENGGQITIYNNQIEYNGTQDQASPKKGMIYVKGTNSPCEHIIIDSNNLGGGTHLDYLITVDNAQDTIITRNRMVAVNEAEIAITSNAYRTIVKRDNYGISQQSNPRTGTLNRYIVDDNGNGTMGVWKQSSSLNFIKTDDDIVYFDTTLVTSSSTTTICTLPQYFRPENNLCVKAISSDGQSEAVVQIGTNGVVRFLNEQSANTWNIPSGFKALRYN